MRPQFLFVCAGCVAISVLVNDREIAPDEISDRIPHAVKSSFRRIVPHLQQDHIRIPVANGQTVGESLLYGNVGRSRSEKAASKHAPASHSPIVSSEPSAPPMVVISSKTSWVKEYLAFRDQSAVSVQAIPDVSARREDQMTSAISNYQNLQADQSDLRAWTRYIVQSNGKSKETTPDYTFKKFGASSGPIDTTEHPKIDVEDFIGYLISVHGFSPADVAFLRRSDLDHGLEEIEKELNRARDKQKIPASTIDIGGDIPNAANRVQGGLLMFAIALILSYLNL